MASGPALGPQEPPLSSCPVWVTGGPFLERGLGLPLLSAPPDPQLEEEKVGPQQETVMVVCGAEWG